MAKNLDEPVVYGKGDDLVMAYTVDDEVRLKHEGYRPQGEAGDTGDSSGPHLQFDRGGDVEGGLVERESELGETLYDYRESLALSDDDEEEDDQQ